MYFFYIRIQRERENGCLFTCVLSSLSSFSSIRVREQQAPSAEGGLSQARSQMVLTLSQTFFFFDPTSLYDTGGRIMERTLCPDRSVLP